MLPATVSAPAAEPPASILAAYAAHRARSGRGNVLCHRAARVFVRRWPRVQDWAGLPLRRRLAADHNTRPFITFLMVTRRLRPFTIDGKVVHQVGMPWHWGYEGVVTGDIVNELTALVADPNVTIHEGKAFVCNVEKA